MHERVRTCPSPWPDWYLWHSTGITATAGWVDYSNDGTDLTSTTIFNTNAKTGFNYDIYVNQANTCPLASASGTVADTGCSVVVTLDGNGNVWASAYTVPNGGTSLHRSTAVALADTDGP